MKNSQQLKDLIGNKAEKLGINRQALLHRYFMEKFLERISKSHYCNSFILKGGVLVSALIGLNIRATQDIDLTIKNVSYSNEEIVRILSEISQIDNNDNIIFAFEKTQIIKEGFDYPGIRAFFIVNMDSIREKIHIDISAGDIITPKEVVFGYPLLLEEKSIALYAYTLETVLAEKIETILSRNITNTRARDYFDCYMLEKLFAEQINYKTLAQAIKNTMTQRGTLKLLINTDEILIALSFDSNQSSQWKRYQHDNHSDSKIEFTSTINAIRNLIKQAELL